MWDVFAVQTAEVGAHVRVQVQLTQTRQELLLRRLPLMLPINLLLFTALGLRLLQRVGDGAEAYLPRLVRVANQQAFLLKYARALSLQFVLHAHELVDLVLLLGLGVQSHAEGLLVALLVQLFLLQDQLDFVGDGGYHELGEVGLGCCYVGFSGTVAAGSVLIH